MPGKKPRAPGAPPGSARKPGASPPAPVVVGIGASAGGLEALEKLFSLMPEGSGLAFVVVQHLERRHPSILAELLGRHTRMPVTQAEDGARPEPDHVYVIAPNTSLTLSGGALRVGAAPEPGSPARIDAFLESLAEDRGEDAMGVLLSGSGRDGTVGLRAVREHGGLALAQDPRTARHGGMPQAAIDAGVVDQVLQIEDIPGALAAYARHLEGSGAALEAELAPSLVAICTLLQQRTGHDFSRYKEGTLLRRIRRRLHVHRAASADEYLRVLEQDPGEPQRLLKDLLIGVTEFFRDAETFGTLQTEILPRILLGKPEDAPIRIWVPGCATGEEAYSIAVLIHERLAWEETQRFVQIFATDLDAGMVAHARAGRYPADIAEQVSAERLERFFARDGAGWQVRKDLRDMCIFSVHSLIRDPPFSALDLISCRNVLIYLEPDLQDRVVPLLHYALRRGGYLLLGPAEGLVSHPDLFETVDKRHRIFRRKETIARPQVDFPLSPRIPARMLEASSPEAAPPGSPQKITAAIERMLLDGYAPPCAVVNERGDIQFVAGRIGRFFAPAAGAPPTNLLDAVRDGLRVEVRTALRAAAATGARLVRDDVPVEVEEGVRRVRLTVRPVPGADGLFAIVLQEQALDAAQGLDAAGETLLPPAMEQIESELRSTRADLKAAVESAEAANEELRSANEELVSTNEELQSANEELQTSKEELQSLNEELETVNSELQRKVAELGTANSDLLNLFASTEIATIFLERDLRISRFTPAATELFHLLPADVGRSIADLAPRFDGQDLVADAREALRTLKAVERQVRVPDRGAWFILRVLPYRTVENVIAGVVVTFVDVSDLKRAEARREYLASFPGKNPNPIVEADLDGRVKYANPAALRLLPDLQEKGSAHPWLAGWQAAARPVHEGRAATHVRIVTVGDRSYHQSLVYAPEEGVVRAYGMDITDRVHAEEALRESEKRFRALVTASSDVVYRMSADWSELRQLRGRGFIDDALEPSRTWLREYIHPDDQADVMEAIGEAIRTRSIFELEHRVLRADGSLGWTFSRAVPLVDANGEIYEWFGAASDVTSRRQAVEALERSRQGLSRLAQASLSVIVKTDLDGMLQAISEAALALTGARMATCGHGHVGAQAIVGGSARVAGAPACPPGNMFAMEKGGVHMDLVDRTDAVRLTDAELRAHPRWWGAPADHVPMRGLLGVRMVGRNGQPSGMILVTDKEQGDFTEEDASLLRQLATIASLALQHVEARLSLEAADRSKNEFLAMLSHELRNPLAPVRNSLFILDRAAPGGDQARRAQGVIVRQVEHLTRLVDDLLDVTRISRGKVQLQRERLDLAELLRRAAEDHRAPFVEGSVGLEVAVPERPVFTTGDRTRLAQVVGNLLENAAKFTDRGGEAALSLEENASLRQAVIRVRDNGAGIAAEMLPRVFEPFTQADNTLDRSKGGLGLGLALVRGLVEMHGGTVTVESEGLGKGAEFTVRLPLEAAEDAGAVTGGAVHPTPRRVLVIEDNVDAAESLRDVLELDDHTVEVAFAGAEGIEKARAFRPDVVLCDVGLPGMDGYAVARTMRADPALRETRLVALTGYASPRDVAMARAAGFDAHLAKPLTLEKLEEALAAGGGPDPAAP